MQNTPGTLTVAAEEAEKAIVGRIIDYPEQATAEAACAWPRPALTA